MSDSQNLAAALDSIDGERLLSRSSICAVSKVLEQMPVELADKFREAMRRPNVTATSLARLLTANGYTIQASSIARHRRRANGTGCLCKED